MGNAVGNAMEKFRRKKERSTHNAADNSTHGGTTISSANTGPSSGRIPDDVVIPSNGNRARNNLNPTNSLGGQMTNRGKEDSEPMNPPRGQT